MDAEAMSHDWEGMGEPDDRDRFGGVEVVAIPGLDHDNTFGFLWDCAACHHFIDGRVLVLVSDERGQLYLTEETWDPERCRCETPDKKLGVMTMDDNYALASQAQIVAFYQLLAEAWLELYEFEVFYNRQMRGNYG